ncbi:MAG: phytanoyl-CoA dioxygenase family protein [Alphaproteobacteria bacterium]|nr:phytanoyl-CoA dioxygenase family protein [Alphaproteobacteria bacterium]
MAQVQTVKASTDTSKIVDIIKEDGCVVIEGLLSAKEASDLQTNMTKEFERVPDCNGDFYGHSTKRIGKLFTQSETFQKMAVLPSIIEIMDSFLLDSCSDYQINLTQAISIGPSEIKQILHQDDPMFPFLHPNYEVMLNCMWAIDDFTDENGATILIPGSHLWPRTQALNISYENLPPNMVAHGVMKKGSVLIYLGSLFHSGGQNKTNQRRCGAVISYSLGWLRQAENSYLAYKPEEVNKMPERLKRLLGYFVHEPNLGSVNGIDPYDFALKSKTDSTFTEFIPEIVKPILKDYVKKQKEAA